MKYIWIVMLIIVDIIWFIFSLEDFIETVRFIFSLEDFIETARQFRIKYILESLEKYTIGFILLHLLVLFGYSFGLFIKGLG